MLTCKILGHTPPMYAGTPSYGRMYRRGADGIGREHGVVYANCDRCGEEYLVIRIHIPKVKDAAV